MKMVIDISESILDIIYKDKELNCEQLAILQRCIRNGALLPKANIIDKIRKEILEKFIDLNCTEVSDVAKKIAYMEALKIIDKYKKESEGDK